MLTFGGGMGVPPTVPGGYPTPGVVYGIPGAQSYGQQMYPQHGGFGGM